MFMVVFLYCFIKEFNVKINKLNISKLNKRWQFLKFVIFEKVYIEFGFKEGKEKKKKKIFLWDFFWYGIYLVWFLVGCIGVDGGKL